MPAKSKSTESKTMNWTPSELVKLSQSNPGLAKEIYDDTKAGTAYKAFAKFQANLEDVPQTQTVKVYNKRYRKYVPMYHYARFIDLKHTVDKAIKDTGLSIMQLPGKSQTVHLPVLDRYGNPVRDKKTGQLEITLGLRLSETTIIFYKNGYKFPNSYEVTVAQTTSPQDIGTAATYAKRYSLAQAIGAASKPDADGRQRNGNSRVFGQSAQQQSRPQQSRPKPVAKITSAQAQSLTKELDEVVAKQKIDKNTAIQYIAEKYGNTTSIANIPKSQFANAKAYLDNQLK